jgi:hypothetical protein
MNFKKWAWRAVASLALALLVLVVAVAVDGWAAMGTGAKGERLARMQHSPQYADGKFENPQPMFNDVSGSLSAMFNASPYAGPTADAPLQPKAVVPQVFFTPPASGLRVTWLGHSATLVEVDGVRVMTDPMWSQRPSPVQWMGPKRWYEPLVSLDQLPAVDVVVISHDHYDHLDMATAKKLGSMGVTFAVPLGVGAHLEGWGIPQGQIRELDWWEQTTIKSLTLVCVPARHASGRSVWDYHADLWSGWAMLGRGAPRLLLRRHWPVSGHGGDWPEAGPV